MQAPRWLSRRVLRWALATLLLATLGPAAFQFAAKKFDPYKLAIRTARQNRTFVDALGSPVGEGWFFEEEEQFGNPATAKLLIPVRGSSRSGNLRVVAVKENGQWRLLQLTLEVANSDDNINLLASID